MINGATLRHVVYDILTDFKKVHDDVDITPYQILYWVIIHADRLRKLHIEKRDSGAFVVPYDVTLTKTGDQYKFTLPTSIYDFNEDRGIEYLTYDQNIDAKYPMLSSVLFTRVAAAGTRRLFFRDDEKPSPDNPYFYRLQDTIYLLGIEDLVLTTLEVGLKASLDPTDVSMDIDQAFDFPQDLLSILKRQIIDLGRFALMLPKDLTNDGNDQVGQVPTQKIIGVNDVVNPQV